MIYTIGKKRLFKAFFGSGLCRAKYGKGSPNLLFQTCIM
ncbi:hypothetical protein C943_00829 [Mariniradius saccharolyticus AK6]|uniref:Uncharacterized protein n=1 Tax=Mariniradius saccharolyticus AK6 TaxID=1239962 RepID=M7XE59_9BACT|nr:hypothetical protein C943_00829 [Mariniradius saccharolyticus AK6]